MSVTRVTGEVSHRGRRHHKRYGKRRTTTSKSYTSSKSNCKY